MKLIYITSLFLLLQAATLLSAQLKVQFNADVVEGCSPIFVRFNNLSEPLLGSTFYWDFGNGNTSTATNPNATFIEPGNYTVKLVMTRGGVKDSTIVTDFIKVRPNPSALFSLTSDTLGCAPLEATFLNQSTDPSNSSLTFLWSFGDGSKSTETNPTATYNTGGNFDVTLLVTNQYGCTNSFTRETLLHILKPIAKFGVNQTNSCTGSLNVIFNNLTESPINYNSQWQFGDGNVSNLKSPAHQYNSTGNFTVKLTVTDTLGCTNTVERANLIRIVKTTALFNASADTLCPNQTLKLTNTSANANRFTWLFGDGTTSKIENPEKKYTIPGNYPLKLVASNGVCTDTSTLNINIEKVIANFSTLDTFICQLPQTIQYQNHSENGVKYEWRFGNGTTSTAVNPIITAAANTKLNAQNQAFFTDTLTVTSKHGCTNRLIKTNHVKVHVPKALIAPGAGGSAGSLNGCIPMSLLFTDKSSYTTTADSIVSRIWKLGSGANQNTKDFPVEVTTPGKVPVQLTITTARGCVQTATETINAGEKTQPDFALKGDYATCATNAVDFTITSPEASKITNAVWDFGDNDKDAMPVPPHFYVKTGPMNVKLTVYNFGCASSITKDNVVNVLGPIVSFNRLIDCNNPTSAKFESKIENASSYVWNFGDGTINSQNEPNPTHIYEQSGNYKVTLVAANSESGCTYSYELTTNVRHPQSKFTIGDGKTCVNNTLLFDPSQSVDAAPFRFNNETKKYLWVFENEAKTFFTNEALSYSFKNKGEQNISLIIKDENGCADTVRSSIKIFQPKVEFQGNYKLGCMPVTFEFEDQTQSDTTIVDYLWNFGDSNTSTIQNPSHDYTQYGKYNVSLRVTDAAGCVAQLTKNQHVMAVFPSADFLAIDSTLCMGDSTDFEDISQSRIMEYRWEFGNGEVSTLARPTHTFPDTGYYTVSLHIVDNHGCEASSTKNNYIHVQAPPKANFTSDGNSSNCYPFIVQFTDQTETPYPGGWKWNFGENNNNSDLQNPFFIYNKPAHHDVTLVSYTTYGCSDTIVKKAFIKVAGPYAEISVADTVCQQAITHFAAIDKRNIYDIKWDFGDGYTNIGDEVTHAYTMPGNMYPVLFIRADAENTCNKAIVDTVHVVDVKAQFNFKDNTPAGCVPFATELINQSFNAVNFHWNLGNGTTSTNINEALTYFSPGDYFITLTAYHRLGCSDTLKNQKLTVFPLPDIKINRDTIICRDTPASLKASGGEYYLWVPSNGILNPLAPETLAQPDETVRYTLTVTDHNNCTDSRSTLVTVQQRPIVQIPDTTIIIGETVNIDITDWAIMNYQWSPSDGISCINCPTPQFRPMQTTQYLVAVTDTSQCFTIQFPYNITILPKFSVDVPDAFTPNGDNINDKVYVNGWGIKEMVDFRIFNRFGQLVYQSDKLIDGWDGTFNGKPQPIETYQYVVTVKTWDDKILTKKGSIKLIR